MKNRYIPILTLPLVAALLTSLLPYAVADQSTHQPFDPAVFKDPPAQYRGHAMWGYDLSKVTDADIISGVKNLADHHFGGFFIGVSGANTSNLDPQYVQQGKPFFGFADHGVEYMSDEFFRLYRLALEQAKKHHLYVILYDDYFFPTGTVCGQLYKKYPEHMAKRLDKVEKDISGPQTVQLTIPEGTCIGAVAFNKDTYQRIDISDKAEHNTLRYAVPEGNWKVMAFYLNHDAVLKIRNPGLVNYLDPDAVEKFIELSYDRFYDNLKEYFGDTIRMAFYDEPSLHWLEGRVWTASFNEDFKSKFGYSPMTYYPALWYDIGPETQAARNALYGFRAELFQDNFIAKLNNWCSDHGIRLTGHLDQEEIPNPVPINGDLIRMFKHQDIPGADDVFYWGRANTGYKLVTSASCNYDKPVTMAETYAAYEKINDKILLQVAMDQYAMGISFQVTAAGIIGRANNVPDLNRYVGRTSYILQHGRHVADVAILYPIAALQGCFTFDTGWEYAYTGGNPPPEIDYMDIGEILFRRLRVDYTYLHPEVLRNRCIIRDDKLILNNKVNRETYHLLIVPGGSTIQKSTAEKIKRYYDNGGAILATSRLPAHSAEFENDMGVRRTFSQIFNVSTDAIAAGQIQVNAAKGYLHNRNAAGGEAFFLPKPDPDKINAILQQVIPVPDVNIHEKPWPVKTGIDYDGALTYIHKVKQGRDIYFFANSSEKHIDTIVTLCGRKSLIIWNPHSGQIQPADYHHTTTNAGRPTTNLQLTLPAVSSRFFISNPAP